MSKVINKSLRGIRDNIPPGYFLGRTGTGKGPPVLLPLSMFTTPGYVANTTIQVNQAAGGDLSGTYPNPTVAKINGNAVSASAPSDGQALVWSAANSDWEPSNVATADSVPGLDKIVDRFPLDLLHDGKSAGGSASTSPVQPIGWPANADIGTTTAPTTGFLRLKAVFVPSGIKLTGIIIPIFSTTATAHMTPVLYNSDGTSMAPFTLLEGGTTVTGVTPGLLKLPFAAAYTPASDTILYIGYINTTAAPTMLNTTATTYFFSTSSDTPPATESGWTHGSGQIGFWGY